jgi:hypothetical protein
MVTLAGSTAGDECRKQTGGRDQVDSRVFEVRGAINFMIHEQIIEVQAPALFCQNDFCSQNLEIAKPASYVSHHPHSFGVHSFQVHYLMVTDVQMWEAESPSIVI